MRQFNLQGQYLQHLKQANLKTINDERVPYCPYIYACQILMHG